MCIRDRFKAVVYVVLGLFFLLPIAAMVEFATRGVGLSLSLIHI